MVYGATVWTSSDLQVFGPYVLKKSQVQTGIELEAKLLILITIYAICEVMFKMEN